ncbi:hypothetical protein D5085_04065 [Ectothiorhodospiraceae bacterium BW-2]|nr:hypothetical protein D5085_04065 [Ectothiorhodospiraceae bacterium BW-2]
MIHLSIHFRSNEVAMPHPRTRVILLLLMALSGTISSLQAATTTTAINLQPAAPPPPPGSDELLGQIPKGQPAGRYDIAVLIANQHYRDGVPSVAYAHRDLAAMRAYLTTTMGYAAENILIEKDATLGVFKTLFDSNGKLKRFIRPGESRVFIYYVGHGAPHPEQGDGYFVPSDADPDFIDKSGYSLQQFYANLRQMPAKEMIVVLDTCFSGTTASGLLVKNVSPGMLNIRETASTLQQGVVLTSATGNQLSSWYPEKQHSLYTYYFLKGLQGEADQNHDRTITAGEMQSYLATEVSYWAGRLSGRSQQPKQEGNRNTVLARLK